MVISDFIAQLRRLIVSGVQRNGDRIFDISQRLVPVRTGTLKKSGTKEDLTDGYKLAYRTSYAAQVEWGREPKPFVGDQEVTVKAHIRGPFERNAYYDYARHKFIPATRVDAHSVRKHIRTYVGKRVVAIKTSGGPIIYRVLSQEPGFKGRFYLTNAIKEGILFLVDDIMFYLRRFEGRQVKGGV